jgi:hypothetical protein
MMSYSEDSRIDEFCHELTLILRRITGLTSDSLPGDLAMQAEVLFSPREDDDDTDDDGGGDGKGVEGDDDGEYDDEHINK